jgi:signal transduction histidine kinase
MLRLMSMPQSFAPMERLTRYTDFGAAEANALLALRPHIEPHLQRITDRFYDAIKRDEGASALLKDDAQVKRLQNTLGRWIIELLEGPHDEAYFKRRENIGRVHVKIGMPHVYMFTAMSLLRVDLHDVALEVLDTQKANACTQALCKIMDIELAIMLGTFMQEHERRELEDFRQLIISHIPVTVFFLDGEQKVVTETYPHPRICRDDHVTGQPLDEVIHPALFEAAALDKRLAEARAEDSEIVLPRVDALIDGETTSVRITILHLDHPLAESMLYIEDLTDAVRTEARHREAEHLAHLGTMAATVAHEIRNPLAGISSTIQVVSGGFNDDDPRKHALDKVRSQTMRLGELVGDLLSFARPVQADVSMVDLATVAQQAASDADAAAADGRTTLIDGSGRALADAGLLGRVLLNLLLNAWQAGASTVTVKLSDGAVDVIDDGPGIPVEDRERIFEAFVTTKTRGTGLGLALAARAMAAMEGSITLSSDIGKGSTFALRMTRPT